MCKRGGMEEPYPETYSMVLISMFGLNFHRKLIDFTLTATNSDKFIKQTITNVLY